MSVDDLIDPPYFKDLDQRLASKKTGKVMYSVIGAFSLVGGIWVSTQTDVPITAFSITFFSLALICLSLVVLTARSQKSLEQEINKAVTEYIKAERSKLMAIKAKMNDAEWENYKLQLQNQKLLVQLNKKQDVKVQKTTTTFMATMED
jgi:uncharacterized membrane protein